MRTSSPCEKCGWRSAPYVLLRDGTTFRMCDACYWGRARSEDQERSERAVSREAETPRAVAA